MTLVVQVENKPGVLNRVASLFRRRGFNIESLTVGHTEKLGVSRMTIVVDTDEAGADRVVAQGLEHGPERAAHDGGADAYGDDRADAQRISLEDDTLWRGHLLRSGLWFRKPYIERRVCLG